MSNPENLTPLHMRCIQASECPSLHRLEDGRLLVMGKSITKNSDHRALIASGAKCAYDETPVIIAPALLDTYVAEKVREERERCYRLAIDAFGNGISDLSDEEMLDDEELTDAVLASMQLAFGIGSDGRALIPSTPGEEG